MNSQSILPFATISDAVLSDCGRYRYELRRVWGGDPPRLVNFVMLNPSTADASEDDPTIRRCIGFAKGWGYDGILVTNLYAFRATDPEDMWKASDRVGPMNAQHLRLGAIVSELVVLAWGNHGLRDGRGAEVMALLRSTGKRVAALKITGNGQPGHPLYLSSKLAPIELNGTIAKGR